MLDLGPINMNPIRPLLLPLLLLVVVSGCASTAQHSDDFYTLTGSTRFNGKPLSSGEITALVAEPGGRAFTAPINLDGSFTFQLPAGPYFLMGRSLDPASGMNLFGFLINNPIHLYGHLPVPIILPFVTATATPQRINGQGIRGRVLKGGEPVNGAIVAVFLDATDDFHGLPYQESAPTGVDGEYSLDVGPGKYFVLARSRNMAGTFQGPLLKGDLSGFYPHNPVILRAEDGFMLDVPMVQVNRPRGSGTLVPGESIIVQGEVTTITGKAAAGVRVVLYSIPEMLGRPVFISSPTDESGSYRLEVSRDGRFYAAARSVIGRPPETGELMGFYDGTEDHSLLLKMGDRLEGVDIVVKEVW
jgi:hypothetical protein